MTQHKIKIMPFDAAKFLRDEKDVSCFLALVLKDGNIDEFILALSDVARARGIAQLAKDTGLSRESLYKTLSPGAKSRF